MFDVAGPMRHCSSILLSVCSSIALQIQCSLVLVALLMFFLCPASFALLL